MLITDQWLNEHRTRRGGWTRAQFSAIGIDWPPPRYWKNSVIGADISVDAAARFEEGKFVTASGSKVHLQPALGGMSEESAAHMRSIRNP